MTSAAFTINGATSAQTVAAASTVTFALSSTTGVRSVEWSCIGTTADGSSLAAVTALITPAGSPTGATATLVIPSDPTNGNGQAYMIQALVNSGKDDNGTTDSNLTARGIVGTANGSGFLPFITGERLERDTTYGWGPLINSILNGGATLLTAQTTNATVTTVHTIPIAADSVVSFGVRWYGKQLAVSTFAMREATFVYRRVGSAGPTQWGSDVDQFALLKDDAGWGALDHAASSNNVILRVTGKAATTINWRVAYWKTVNT